MITLWHYLAVAAVLFGIGLVGFLTRRNLIVMFLCAEMMLQGVSINLVGFGRFHNNWGGKMLVVFMITVAACEAGMNRLSQGWGVAQRPMLLMKPMTGSIRKAKSR